MDSAHDVNISFCPASGSSVRRIRDAGHVDGEAQVLTIRVCIDCITFCEER